MDHLHNPMKRLVGVAGFEPATPRPPVWCANRAALHSDGADCIYWSLPEQMRVARYFAARFRMPRISPSWRKTSASLRRWPAPKPVLWDAGGAGAWTATARSSPSVS